MKIYRLPNNTKLYIHSDVIETMNKFIQISDNCHENGGFIVGYQNFRTNSIIIDDLTTPYENDTYSKVMFQIKDPKHYEALVRFKKSNSFFIGTWHTHPDEFAHYSKIDYEDWNKSLMIDTPAADYYVFIIVARKELAVWAGYPNKGEITRINEIMYADFLTNSIKEM